MKVYVVVDDVESVNHISDYCGILGVTHSVESAEEIVKSKTFDVIESSELQRDHNDMLERYVYVYNAPLEEKELHYIYIEECETIE